MNLPALIARSAFDGVFFEMPGVDAATMAWMSFEFVLINAPSLAAFAEAHPDVNAFAEHHCTGGGHGGGSGSGTCCSFDNLGGDARLIATKRLTRSKKATKEDDAYDDDDDDDDDDGNRVYSHLAAFVRGADDGQVTDLWQLAAAEYLRTVRRRSASAGGGSGNKTWFSTSGMGVAWLHVRLDSYPKYYQYQPFK